MSFPITPLIPFTMQIFFVFLVCFILTPTNALLSISFYLLLGIVGFPMFSGGMSGIAPFLSPTAGFLTGFLLFPLSLFLPLKNTFLKLLIVFPFFYLFGITVLSYISNMSFLKSASIVFIFIPIDIFKLYIAYIISKKINKVIKTDKNVRVLNV